MDQSISSIFGAVIFTWFVVGLAESISDAPFFIIVVAVVVLAWFSTYQLVKEQLNLGNGKKSSK